MCEVPVLDPLILDSASQKAEQRFCGFGTEEVLYTENRLSPSRKSSDRYTIDFMVDDVRPTELAVAYNHQN
jgi:hypothetical protein